MLAASGLSANFVFSFLTWYFYPRGQPKTLQIESVQFTKLAESSHVDSLEDIPGTDQTTEDQIHV